MTVKNFDVARLVVAAFLCVISPATAAAQVEANFHVNCTDSATESEARAEFVPLVGQNLGIDLECQGGGLASATLTPNNVVDIGLFGDGFSGVASARGSNEFYIQIVYEGPGGFRDVSTFAPTTDARGQFTINQSTETIYGNRLDRNYNITSIEFSLYSYTVSGKSRRLISGLTLNNQPVGFTLSPGAVCLSP